MQTSGCKRCRTTSRRLVAASFTKSEPLTTEQTVEQEARLKVFLTSAPCRGCGQFSHWSKGAACPKNRGKVTNVVGITPVLVAKDVKGASPTAKASSDEDAILQYARECKSRALLVFRDDYSLFCSVPRSADAEISSTAMQAFQSQTESVMDRACHP